MEKIELKAAVREHALPTKIRSRGFIPAVIYGKGIKTEHLEVLYREFEKVFKKAGESTLVDLSIGGKTKNVIIQDIQRHYLTGKFLHVDFYEVNMAEKMKAKVPLVFIGISPAIKENGGVLVEIIKEVEVECLPSDLPHQIEVDISSLKSFDDIIHVKDLKISDKVKISADGEEAVVKANPPRDVEAELAELVVEDVSKVEGAAETPAPSAENAPGEEKPAEKEEKK